MRCSPPLPGAVPRGPANHNGAQFRRPSPDLATPLVQQACGNDKKSTVDLALDAQDTKCSQRLNGLPEAHVVRQQDLRALDQGPDTLQLEFEKWRGPLE